MGLLYTVVAICVQAETSRRGNPPVGFGYKYPICDMALLYGNILFSTLNELSVNRKDLHALTLVGSTRDNPVLDPRAVLHLKN